MLFDENVYFLFGCSIIIIIIIIIVIIFPVILIALIPSHNIFEVLIQIWFSGSKTKHEIYYNNFNNTSCLTGYQKT